MESILDSKEYDFIFDNKHLGDNVCLLCYGGSHAYGINREDSDIDIRGVALNSKRDILLGRDFEQYDDDETDTVIYSISKAIHLWLNCNPSMIEMLGNKADKYLIVSSVGRMLLDMKQSFLSKKCIDTFNGYVNEHLNQLRKFSSTKEVEEEKLYSLTRALRSYDEKFGLNDENFKVYLEDRLYVDLSVERFPLTNLISASNDMSSIVRGYEKMNKRNRHAIAHDKINKHMANLLRVFMMGIDILDKGLIQTYRNEDERKLLLSIYNGEVSEDEFFKLFDSYRLRFDKVIKTTKLPSEPDYDLVYNKLAYINESVVRGIFDGKRE